MLPKMYGVIVIFSVLASVTTVAATETANVTYDVVMDPETGPVVHISCSLDFDYISIVDVRWKFKGQVMAQNLQLTEADSSRYSVSDSGLRLSLRNALKENFGIFTCIVQYKLNQIGDKAWAQKSENVSAEMYLPPLNFPKCRVHQGNLTVSQFTVGSDVTFQCDPGESKPPVNLNLTLLRTDSSVIILGDQTTTRKVTVDDNGVTFFCKMSSDTFKNCSTPELFRWANNSFTNTNNPTTAIDL